MQRRQLGQSGIEVSELCLGTMTWGSQTPEAGAGEQMALALDHGVTFWDTAEMYPTNPTSPETVGLSEAIIGRWLARAGGRDRVQLATKITGIGHPHARAKEGKGSPPITGASLRTCVEASLRRLQTDHIDLYQLHWPNRGGYAFRRHWSYQPATDRRAAVDSMADILRTAAALQAEGKVRAFGLSNETVWGATQWHRLAAQGIGPRMASVQNEYSLMCRLFDTDWAEYAVMENMPLLAFSPVAGGMLTGKYSGDATPPGSRRAATPDLGGRVTPAALAAADAYAALAVAHGLAPSALAIAFCLDRPFPCIPIVGASTTAQLRTVLAAPGIAMTDDLRAGIARIHRLWPMPF